MDPITKTALGHISRLRYAHPLARLVAHGLLERHLGIKVARSVSLLSDSELRELLSKAFDHLVLAPYQSPRLKIVLDRGSDLRTDVDILVNSLRNLRERLQSPPLHFPTRLTAYDQSLPPWRVNDDHRFKALSAQVQQIHERSKGLDAKIQTSLVPVTETKVKFPVVTQLADGFYLVKKGESALAVVAAYLDNQVMQVIELPSSDIHVHRDARSQGFIVDMRDIQQRHVYFFSRRPTPRVRLVSSRGLTASECDRMLYSVNTKSPVK